MKEHSSVSQSVWQNWILEAIRKIRKQKQRPSDDRIYAAIKQHHNVTNEDLLVQLEKCVNQGVILKVINKGQVSYKDPARVMSRKLTISSESDPTKAIIKAVREMKNENGSSLKEIEKYLTESRILDLPDDLDFPSYLKSTVNRAAARGLLIQEGKLYKAPPKKDNDRTPSGRRRKTEEKELTPKKTPLPICSECLGTASKNRNGEPEDLSSCSGCGMSLHLSCVTGHHAAEFAILIGKGNCWYCEECLSCNECGAFKDEAYLLNCNACERCYHMLCLTPPVEKKPKAPWKCSFCLQSHKPGTSEKSKSSASTSGDINKTPSKSTNYHMDLKERKKQMKKQRLAARLEHSGRRKSSKVNVGAPESSSEDGNDSSPDSPLSPPVPPVGGFREETISKEKQKFFRLNSFYGIKGRGPSRCKAEGRPVRDISCSSSSSEQSSVENDTKKPLPEPVPSTKISPGHAKPKPLSSSTSNSVRKRTPEKRKSNVGSASGVSAKENVTVTPFSSLGSSLPCVTFGDLAKKCGNDKIDTAPQLPAVKLNASWLEKPKAIDTANDIPTKNNFTRIFSGKSSSVTKVPDEKPRPPTAAVSAPSTVDSKDTVKVTSHVKEPSSSESRSQCIKPSSSIVSRRSPVSKTEPEFSRHDTEELWGFAAAAARKEVTPVLHLDKEGAPSYPSYNVFLSNIWKSNSLRNTAVVADGHEASLDEDVERPPKKRDALSLSLSPSKLVKSAVISKQYEHVRRNMLSSNTPFPYVNQSGDVIPSDKDTIEKNLIAEATKTQHFQVCRHLNHLSVQSVSVPPSRPYNQSVIYSMSKILAADLPSGVTQKDIELYYEVQRRAKKATEALLPENTFDATPGSSGSEQPKCPAAIEFGKWEIQTWYSSPFPQEYARLPKLFICEFCLKYAKSKAILLRHLSKCKWRYPPGTEIYRTDNLSVFEVDGNVNKIYSQTLCLLAKLFLDHKTLYYDVEPFLFYVLTKNDEKGCHLVGYFSKEKHCQQKYNVSCIMTLPQYQRQGYGRFLIDFSYLLSRKEGKPGTPEKPLSDLGLVSYKAYWKSVILQYFHDHKSSKSVTIEKISLETGIMSHDIATALQELDMVRRLPNGDHVIVVDRKLVNASVEKAKNNKSRIVIEPVLLRWTPLLPNTVKQFEEGTRNDEEGESGANTNSEDEAERKAVVATTSKISPKKQNHAPTPKTGKKRKAAAPVTETPAAKKRASRLPVQEEVKHDTEDEVEQRPKKRRRTSYLEMSKIKDEKPSGVVLKSSRLSAAQAQDSTAITSTSKTSRKSVKDVGLKSSTKKPETPIKKEPIREKSPVTEDEGCNRRSSRRLSKKTQIKEEKSERNRKTKPETPAKATKTEAKTKEPPPKEPTPKGRPPKMAKIKREPTPEVRTPPKEEEKEPVNIIVIRKKTPIKKKPKTASKRQHSLAAKKRWIARKAKQESSQAANDSGAMEVDDVQMPQLCPVTDVETANEIYHNPPVLDKKPECDSHDEEALESKDPKEEEKDEKDDKEDDNNEKNVEEKPSPENDSYQPEKMDTSEENSETQDKDNSSSHLPSTNPDESLPKSPARSPGTKDRADMDSYSCGDRMLQMSTYSQSSSSQSPSSLPSSRSMVSPQPLTPSSTDSHMSRDKSPSPHREKPDDTFKNTSTESVTEDDSKVKKEPEPECEPIERTKSEQAQPKNEQEQVNFRDENKKTDKDTQRDQTETKQSDDEKSDDMKIPPSQTTSMAEPTLPKNDVASPADKSEQTLDTKATAPSPPVPSHQHGVHEAVSAPESKNDSDVDAQKKDVTRMPEPPARSSHINDSTIPVPVPATTTVAPISTSNLPYQAPCTVASAMMYAQTPPMPMNDVAHTMQQRLEEMKYPQPVNMPSNVPVSSADDERAFRKLSTYYENQYANERDKMMASDKYRYPVDDKAPKDRPPSMDMNKSYMNEISNCGNVPYGSFAPMPGPLIMGPDKVVNLSDGRGYPPPSPHHGVMSNIHEPTPAMVISPVAPKMDSEQQERYPKNKRSKCTSPTKLEKKDAASAVAKNNSTHDSGLQGGMQNAKKYHDKEDRFYKESNLEQSLMKVKKMAQTEEDSKYKDRKCAKPPMVAGKDKKMTKSPSYSMDNTTTASAAMAPTPEITIAKPPMTDEMKYKNMRRDVDEHMASVSNIDSGQHFVPGPMMKQPVPSPHGDSRSMGVYTPDSTTNSVHSVHGYGQYDMDAGHLNIESPNSISSNDMNTSGEPTRPPSAALPMHQMYIDSQQQAMLALHHLQQSHTMHGLSQLHTAPPPQHPPPAMISHHVVGKSSQSGRKNANNVSHHHHRSNKSVASGGSGSSGGSGHHHNMNNALHHRSTPPSVTNAHSPNTFVGAVNAPNNAVAAGIPHRSTPPGVNHQPQSRHHQIGPYSHGHHPATAAAMIAQSGYLGVSQMPTGSYPPSVPVTTVIQHRMTPSSDVAPPPSPVAQTQQRLGSSPCSTSSPTGFYIQSPMHHSPHMHSSGGGAPPISSTPPSGGPSCPSRMQNSQAAMNACSLAKLQQLTNGFDVLPPGHGGTMAPSSPINLTPPPAVSSHGNMTTPPVAHHLPPQANLANYKLFAAGNIPSSATSPMPSVTTSSGTSSSSGRSSSRGSHHAGNASNSVSRAAAAAAAAGMSPNVTINPNLMSRYGGNPYGYQMPGQPAPGAQTLSYITNGAPPAFINQTQLPVRMGVMNMAQNQYGQDPTQNSMYSAATYYPSFIR